MGLTFDEAEQLGLAHEHPDHPSRRKDEAQPKRNKYGAVRTEYNGRKYDSKAEAYYAEALDHLKTIGQVERWTPQVPFRLGCPENVYVVDFIVVYSNGSTEAHEVKGRRTAKFNHDLRLWEAYGPYPLKVITNGRLVETVIPRSLQ